MPKCLKKVGSNNLYHLVEGEKVNGKTPTMRGECSGLYGECSGLYGECSGLIGCCTYLFGDLDKITADERKEFPEIELWVEA